MLTPILPRLRPVEGGLHPPDKRGWDFRPLSELTIIANSLDVSLRPGFTSYAVDAIPDLWARLLLFDYALREPDHPLHGASIAMFRGFLSLLALRERKNLNLQSVELDLSKTGGREFHSVAQRLRPEARWMAEDTKWDKIFVFTLDGQAVGITSPLTMVCPAEGAHLTALARTGWCFDGFRFRSPEDALDNTDRKLVANWVSKLGKSISGHDRIQEGDTRQTTIVSELTAFKDAILNKLPQDQRVIAEPELSDHPLSLSYGIYPFLGAALKGGPVAIDRSMVRLRCLRPKTGQDTLLIIDKALDGQWNVPATDIVVANGFSLKDVQTIRLGLDTKTLGTGVHLPSKCEWRYPDTFFTDRLVLIRGLQGAFPGAHKLHGQDDIANRFGGAPIIPLRSELFSYLTADYIRETAFYEATKDGIRFGLKLPLEGGRSLVISQEFGPNGQSRDGRPRPLAYEDHGVPVLEIWPDYASAAWKTYFVFWDSRGGDVLYAKPFGAIEGQFPEKRPNGLREREVTQLAGVPEFLQCSIREKQTDGSFADVESGVLLPRLEPLQQESSAEYHIGVDFGTTNTNVHMRREDDRPIPLALRTVTHAVTAPLQSDREASLYRSFLPPATKGSDNTVFFETSPFLSFFSTRVGAPEGDIQPIQHGHILFYNVNYNDLDIGTNRVSTNLKWRDQDKPKLESYLRQVCMHSAVEAFRLGAKKIHWYYSLPTAFPIHKVEDFRVNWTNISKWVSVNLGVASEPPIRQTESVVAAKYFASLDDGRQAFPSAGAAFIDIGGGTSDISIWQNNKLLLQSSIRLSGDQIILDPLFRQRRSILPVFPPDILSTDQRQELEQIVDRRVFYAKTDALFRSHGERMVKWLVKAPGSDPNLKRFIDYIGLGLCGLFFYTGLMFRHLQERNTFQLKSAADLDLLPSVHVGGNGCKLFHWVAKGAYSDDANINEIFRGMFLEGAGWKSPRGKLKIRISDHPKAEAACGLVVKYQLSDGDSFDEAAFDSLVAGEKFTVDGTAYESTSLISREVIQKNPAVQNLESLYKFIDVYNTFAEKPGRNLAPIRNGKQMAVNVHKVIDQWTNQQGTVNARDVELEPLFVVGLKAFLTEFLQGGEKDV